MLTREILILPIMTGCIIVRGIRCIIARGGDFVLQRSQLQIEPAPAPGRGAKYSSARVQYKHKEKHITSINTHTHKIAKNKIIKGKPDILRCVCVFGGGGGVTPLLVPDRKQMCPLSGKNPLTSSYLYGRPVFETLLSYLSPLTFVAWRQLERW